MPSVVVLAALALRICPASLVISSRVLGSALPPSQILTPGGVHDRLRAVLAVAVGQGREAVGCGDDPDPATARVREDLRQGQRADLADLVQEHAQRRGQPGARHLAAHGPCDVGDLGSDAREQRRQRVELLAAVANQVQRSLLPDELSRCPSSRAGPRRRAAGRS